ncbi:MAG TPA: TetR/AcrR family transcriptional regulator [Acidimicrobiales bacterium]|nr:TetR/AcrR family transcriptional regulator [Acidimicrobiales bacterium]
MIIETAARAFAEHGFEAVSLNELVAATGMSKGAFYFHFSTKEEVALAAFRSKQIELIERLAVEVDANADVVDQLTAILLRRAELVSDDPSLHCVIRLGGELSARSNAGSDYASFMETATNTLAGLIRRGIRSGEFRRQLDPEATARAVFAWIVGMDSLSLLDSAGKDLAQRTDEVLALLIPALTADPSRKRRRSR